MIRRTACLVSRSQDAWRNQAIEKHLMDTLPEDTAVLFLWQDACAVLLGRGQSAAEACAPEQLARRKGQLARRLSGGGGLYMDGGCLGFSVILPKSAFDVSRQMSILGMTLGAFGLQARTAGPCDLGVGDVCVGRSAYYKSGSAAWHHGALLIQADLDALGGVLLPDGQRHFAAVQNVSALCPGLTMEDVQRTLCQAFAHGYGSEPAWLDERMLDGRTIDGLTAAFARDGWVNPPAVQETFSVTERFPWGGATVHMAVEGGVIRQARFSTDAMEAALFERVAPSLVGAPFLISAIAARFDQSLQWLSDPHLMQIAQDVCNLICRRLRQQH